MKQTYESPLVRFTDLELEGFLCASGEEKDYINAICGQVAPYEDMGTATYSDDIIL